MFKNLLEQNKRRCWKCKKIFELNENNFSKNKNEIAGLAYICVKCARIKRKEYYYKNKESEKRKRREWYKNGGKEKVKEWRKKYQNTVKAKFLEYQRDAKRENRNIKWELTIEEFGKLVTQECFYCGEYKKDKLVGVDRKDCKKGYTKNNCVPCCSICNRVKWILTTEEFIDRCKRIVKNYKKKCI